MWVISGETINKNDPRQTEWREDGQTGRQAGRQAEAVRTDGQGQTGRQAGRQANGQTAGIRDGFRIRSMLMSWPLQFCCLARQNENSKPGHVTLAHD